MMTMMMMMMTSSVLLLLLLQSCIEVHAEPVQLSYQDIQEIVELHNDLRKAEGGSNMEKLVWNNQLAELAQGWASRCWWGHGQLYFDPKRVGFDELGQNIYAHEDPTMTYLDMVQGWFDEKKDFDYNSASCRAGTVCGHYTQVVWAETREIGCGVKKCGSISNLHDANYLVCNYGPAGNGAGKPYKKGEACTQCDSGKFFCTDQLCDSWCSSVGQGSSCACRAQCGNCGRQTSLCTCDCEPGWMGVACDEPCHDDPMCGANPGYPSSWCTPDFQWVLDACPKMCGYCEEAPAGGGCRP